MATFDWNRWQVSTGISGNLRAEYAVWTNDGSISHKDTMRCLELMGQEVLPALREIGTELELTDPFQQTP